MGCCFSEPVVVKPPVQTHVYTTGGYPAQPAYAMQQPAYAAPGAYAAPPPGYPPPAPAYGYAAPAPAPQVTYVEQRPGMSTGTAALAGGAVGMVGGVMLGEALAGKNHHGGYGYGGGYYGPPPVDQTTYVDNSTVVENNYYVQDAGNTYVDQGSAGGMWGDSGLAGGGMDIGGGMDTSSGCDQLDMENITLPHSGDSTANIWKAEEPASPKERASHETIQHHKARAHPRPGETDAELLRDEGADLPHQTMAGHVALKGADAK